MPGVFISYRREDSAGVTGRLFDFLCAEFGRKNIYMDLDTIVGGEKFASVIVQKIGVSDVLLAVIGDRWLTAGEEHGIRRLDNPQDFVRIEIARALTRGMRVIPVLVSGAVMPLATDLPDDLKPLCERQAMEIRDAHFHPDAQQLVDVLHTALPGIEMPRVKVNLGRFAPAVLAAAGLVLFGSGMLFFRQQPRVAAPPVPKAVVPERSALPTEPATPRTEAIPAKPPRVAPDIAGRWQATVKYDWGDTYDETFDFEVDGDEISGTAGLFGDKPGNGRAIVEGKITGNRIRFVTRTLTIPGPETDIHTYRGTVEGGTIRFTMMTESKSTEHTPIHFTARRAKSR